MATLDQFLNSLPGLSSNPARRIRMLAKELALGASLQLWDVDIEVRGNDVDAFALIPWDNTLKTYFERRWGHSEVQHHWKLLFANGYLAKNGYFHRIQKPAFDLMDETEPDDIFISYKRSESSAFALVVLCRLKAHDKMPFVDMALEAGGNWHADLEERITGCDYFIILLGEDTLASEMTVKEISWALRAERMIIPVWHSGFDIGADKWSAITADVKDALQQTNAIRVTDESASGYNTAIVELLNRFGITP